jgi:carboxypeptidase family protein
MSIFMTVLVALSLGAFQQAAPATSADLAGRVVFAGAAVPGATVTAIRTERSVSTVSDDNGMFRFPNLEDGVWAVRVEMRGFVTVSRDITLPFSGPPIIITLTMRPYEEIVSRGPTTSEPSAASPQAAAAAAETSPPDAAEIINGSVINGIRATAGVRQQSAAAGSAVHRRDECARRQLRVECPAVLV